MLRKLITKNLATNGFFKASSKPLLLSVVSTYPLTCKSSNLDYYHIKYPTLQTRWMSTLHNPHTDTKPEKKLSLAEITINSKTCAQPVQKIANMLRLHRACVITDGFSKESLQLIINKAYKQKWYDFGSLLYSYKSELNKELQHTIMPAARLFHGKDAFLDFDTSAGHRTQDTYISMWHRDKFPGDLLTAIVPLETFTEENGATEFIPSSAKEWKADGIPNKPYFRNHDAFAESNKIQFHVDKGNILLFDSNRLWHRARPVEWREVDGRSTKPSRYSIVLRIRSL